MDKKEHDQIACDNQQHPQASTKQSVMTTKGIEDAGDVTEWREAIDDDATGLIWDLRFKYLNGCSDEKGADKILVHYFDQLKDWIRVAEKLNQWHEMEEMRSLGNRALTFLRAQRSFISKGAKIADVLTIIDAERGDFLDKAVEKASKKFTWGNSHNSMKAPFSRQRRQGSRETKTTETQRQSIRKDCNSKSI